MDPYILFLDDERFPSEDLLNGNTSTIICRTCAEAQQAVLTHGLPQHTCFDHDLGENIPTGFDFAKWLVNYCLDRDIQTINYSVHSQNPPGAANIKGLIDQYNGLKSIRV